jgi:CBS domain containing-hemolysin-like protein
LKPHYVNADDSIDDLLDSMRQQKIYLAIVKNSDGKVAGLVTIEDFLEELVGEIWDEEDVVDTEFYKLGGNRYCVDARLKMSDVFGRIGISVTDPKLASYTIGFWFTYAAGHLPEEGETLTYENVEVTVDKVSKKRIISLILKVPESNNDDSEAAQ